MKQYLKFDLTPNAPALIYYPQGKDTNDNSSTKLDGYKLNLTQATTPDAKTKHVNQLQFSINRNGVELNTTDAKPIIEYQNGRIVAGGNLTSVTVPFESLSEGVNNKVLSNNLKSGFVFARYNKVGGKSVVEACLGINTGGKTKYSVLHSEPISSKQIPKQFSSSPYEAGIALKGAAGALSTVATPFIAMWVTLTHVPYRIGKELSHFPSYSSPYTSFMDRIFSEGAFELYDGITGSDGDERVPLNMQSEYLGRSEEEKQTA